jgi:hypothetical protein
MQNLKKTRWAWLVIACACFACFDATRTISQTTDTLVIRGNLQKLYIYGIRGGTPVIVSSGDGGWIHLGPHIAEALAAKGFFVVGFNVKSYLESFTTRKTWLRPEEEPGDYKLLAEFAGRGNSRKPILIGVSEGAGLSVLAATDPESKAAIAGVLAVGLPNLNELAWHWKDSIIYITHRVPDEPTFSAAAIINQVAPVPLAAIHSTQDEFVPLADFQKVFMQAREPKKLWIVQASDHRFSNNLGEFDRCLFQAIDWIEKNEAR